MSATHASFPTTARVNSAMLQKHVTESVRLVGRVESQNGTYAVIQASDKGQVQVHMSPESQYGTRFMEIIGVVNADLSISELASTNFGDDFNLDTYDAMIVKAQKFPGVF
ncbi:60S acidic ribosomal protein P1-alpha 3 [Gryganskiella cystojenkinii]|nr:60S acidic ribosomal protein P1-alpha 3 [Gryganskiella cystojenkinii]